MLLTKWGKRLDKNNPLSEYPRPQFVRDSYIFRLSLIFRVFTERLNPVNF